MTPKDPPENDAIDYNFISEQAKRILRESAERDKLENSIQRKYKEVAMLITNFMQLGHDEDEAIRIAAKYLFHQEIMNEHYERYKNGKHSFEE